MTNREGTQGNDQNMPNERPRKSFDPLRRSKSFTSDTSGNPKELLRGFIEAYNKAWWGGKHQDGSTGPVDPESSHAADQPPATTSPGKQSELDPSQLLEELWHYGKKGIKRDTSEVKDLTEIMDNRWSGKPEISDTENGHQSTALEVKDLAEIMDNRWSGKPETPPAADGSRDKHDPLQNVTDQGVELKQDESGTLFFRANNVVGTEESLGKLWTKDDRAATSNNLPEAGQDKDVVSPPEQLHTTEPAATDGSRDKHDPLQNVTDQGVELKQDESGTLSFRADNVVGAGESLGKLWTKDGRAATSNNLPEAGQDKDVVSPPKQLHTTERKDLSEKKDVNPPVDSSGDQHWLAKKRTAGEALKELAFAKLGDELIDRGLMKYLGFLKEGRETTDITIKGLEAENLHLYVKRNGDNNTEYYISTKDDKASLEAKYGVKDLYEVKLDLTVTNNEWIDRLAKNFDKIKWDLPKIHAIRTIERKKEWDGHNKVDTSDNTLVGDPKRLRPKVLITDSERVVQGRIVESKEEAWKAAIPWASPEFEISNKKQTEGERLIEKEKRLIYKVLLGEISDITKGKKMYTDNSTLLDAIDKGVVEEAKDRKQNYRHIIKEYEKKFIELYYTSDSDTKRKLEKEFSDYSGRILAIKDELKEGTNTNTLNEKIANYLDRVFKEIDDERKQRESQLDGDGGNASGLEREIKGMHGEDGNIGERHIKDSEIGNFHNALESGVDQAIKNWLEKICSNMNASVREEFAKEIIDNLRTNGHIDENNKIISNDRKQVVGCINNTIATTWEEYVRRDECAKDLLKNNFRFQHLLRKGLDARSKSVVPPGTDLSKLNVKLLHLLIRDPLALGIHSF